MALLEGWYSAQSALLTLIGINVVLALSVSVGLSCGLLSLANAAFMGVGAYTVALLTPYANLPLWAAPPVGALAAIIVAVPLGLPVLRLPGVFLAVVTLGFGELFSSLAPAVPLAQTALIPAGGATQTTWWHIGLAILAVCYLYWHIGRSRLGHAFALIRQDETLAASLGINVAAHKLAAFVLGACVAGLAGGLAVNLPQGVVPAEFGVYRAETILFAAVIGGSGAFWGALPGAALLTLLPAWLGTFSTALAGYRAFNGSEVLAGALVLLTLVFCPGGLSGAIWRWRQRGRDDGDRPALDNPSTEASAGEPALLPAPEGG